MRAFAVLLTLLCASPALAGDPSRRDVLRHVLRGALAASPLGKAAAAAAGSAAAAAAAPASAAARAVALPAELEFEAMFLAAFDFEGQRRLIGRVRTSAGMFAQIHASLARLRSYGGPVPPQVDVIVKRIHGQLGELYRSWTSPSVAQTAAEPSPAVEPPEPEVTAERAFLVLYWAIAQEGLNPYVPLSAETIPRWHDLLDRWDSALVDLGFAPETFGDALASERHRARWATVQEVRSECVARILAAE